MGHRDDAFSRDSAAKSGTGARNTTARVVCGTRTQLARKGGSVDHRRTAQDVVHLIESKENRLCDAQKAIQNSSGVWEVFYMPHIRSIAEPLGMKVAPLRYRFSKDNSIETEVRIQLGSLVDVWLSADGVVCTRPDGNLGDCYIRFDTFDVSRGDDGPPQRNSDSLLTKTINAIGKLFFFEELSRFPVHVFEDDVCVFAFPPLKSYIATYRVQSADD